MSDIEGNSRIPVQNPYSGTRPPESAFLDAVRRIVYICISGLALNHFNLFRAVWNSPHIQHEPFKVGLACTIAILSIKAYVEMYEGKLKRNEVNYKNFKHTTHTVMVLILLATVAFNVALWPHYGWNSPLVLGICFFGLILNFLLLVPTYVQNIVSFVLLTFFLQQYA